MEAVADVPLDDIPPDGDALEEFKGALKRYQEAGGLAEVLVQNVVATREFAERNNERLVQIEEVMKFLVGELTGKVSE